MPYPIPESQLKKLFSEEQIQKAIFLLKRQIEEDYRGKDLILCGILNGAYIFLADLSRALEIPHQVDFMGASSYENSMESSGYVQITKYPSQSIHGKNVLIVEDVIDTGKTLDFLLNYFLKEGAESTKICSLVVKESSYNRPKIDYYGLQAGREFLVGYGMDYAGYYRNLPYICKIQN